MSKVPTIRVGLLFTLTDIAAIIAAYYTTMVVRFGSQWGEQLFTWINRTLGVRETGEVGDSFRDFYYDSAPRILLQLIIVLCGLYALRDLYSDRRYLRPRPIVWNLIVCNVVALALFYAYFYLQRNQFHPRSIFASILFINTVLASGLRTWVTHVLRRLRAARGVDCWPVVLAGRNRHADRIRAIIEESPDHNMRVTEHLEQAGDETYDDYLGRLRDAAKRTGAPLIIFAEAQRPIAEIMAFLQMAEALDVAAKILSRELDVLLTRARVDSDLIHGIPLVHFAAPSAPLIFSRAKRAGSAVVAAVGLVVLAPILLTLAALIRLTSRGPAFFVQERIGANGKPFRMYKFRTMVATADEELAQLEPFNQSGSALFKIRNDPRVTGIGRILRRYSIDELPQLLNVMRGDMALVGPRPLPVRDLARYYADWHYGRHNGQPGLTCLWQVSGRSELDFHTMCVLDAYYLRNQNIILDLKILWRTIWVVVFAHGAY